ncbi:hypothetical protein [Bartonella bacilliformis]|uniref:Uncharacterized protein n=1 Tax=Bartonella bacilliformis Ver097 TaxID=1293911 RepID=A0A072RCX0_BARBA|nr:hypothetical protein [Bartonella bacilliformis]KEG19334.1 hypothetical protein H710_01116 [Bartonella bacilliformis Ver097]
MTTPIGWILAGMMALIAVGYMLHKHWNKITVSISGLWECVAQKIDNLVEWLYGINLVKAGAHFIESFWDGIRSR